MAENLKIFGTTYSNVAGIKATDTNDVVQTFIKPEGTLTVSSSGTTDCTAYASVSVASGSATTPATTITANPSISVSSGGLITATASATQSVTPTVSAGYVSSGTAGTITVSGSNTSQMTTKGATTYTPTTSNQTISSGTYLTGTQTISGDANLVAGNIKSGTTIFGVTGSYTGGGSSKNAQIWSGVGTVQSSTYTAVANPNSQATMTITVAKTGTYDVYWCGYRNSTSGTWGSRLYINNSGYGSNITTFDQYMTSVQVVHLSGVALTADDVLTVRARSRGSSYTFYIYDLVIIEQ